MKKQANKGVPEPEPEILKQKIKELEIQTQNLEAENKRLKRQPPSFRGRKAQFKREQQAGI